MWKGAISFGLVHIPVALYAATTSSGVDFDWLDKRSMEPVGYKRINKKTGEEIAASDIVKGVQLEDGRYVVLDAEEIRAALPEAMQTIEIESFIPMAEIPLVYLERPYYLAPTGRGEKVYALLREALLETERAGVARVVLRSKQHLAILIPCGPALILNLLRWGGQIRSFEALKLPPRGTKAAGIKDSDMKMARQLVNEMSAPWNADDFRDSFQDEIMRLVHEKAEAGEIQTVDKPAPASAGTAGADIIDLTELLKRSLQAEIGSSGGGTDRAGQQRKKPAAKTSQASSSHGKKKAGTKAKEAGAGGSPRGRKQA